MRKLILFAMLAAPLMAQNYGSYNKAPVARPQFMRSPGAVKGNILKDTSLVVWWPLTAATGNVARDMSGNGNDGTWSGTKAGTNGYWSAGKIGPWAGYFDGSTNYLLKTSPSNLPNGNVAKTVSGWFNHTQCTGANTTGVLGGFGNSATGAEFIVDPCGVSSYPYLLVLGWASDWITSVSRTPYLDGKWHLATVTYDGTTTMFYMDGAVVASTSAMTWNTSTTRIVVGMETNLSSRQFNGRIADFRIYNRALSQAEIQAIYNAENH